MDINNIITLIAGVLGIVIALFTITKFILDFTREFRKKASFQKNTEKRKNQNISITNSPTVEYIKKIYYLVLQRIELIFLFFAGPLGLVLLLTASWYYVLSFFGITINYSLFASILVMDLVIMFSLLNWWVFFFSQFVFPINSADERRSIYKIIRRMVRLNPGRILKIRNGQISVHKGESKQGIGMALIDNSSAIVVRTETKKTKIIGSGVCLLKENEYIAGCVDLRPQLNLLGPIPGDNQIPDISTEPLKYNETIKRRQQTRGLTRDGFEICPTIRIKFKIANYSKNDDKRSVNNIDYNAVENAVSREVIEINASNNQKIKMGWRNLPTHLVVNLWREYVRKFRLEDLFKTEGISGLQTIEEMINRRVKGSQVIALDDTGIPTGESFPSIEYQQLRLHGLEVIEIRIQNILFDSAVEDQIIKNWQAEWTKIAKREKDILSEREKIIATFAHSEAIKLFARLASENYNNPIAPPRDIFTTLQSFVEPIREVMLIEGRTNGTIENEIKKLDEIWKWLIVNKIDLSNHKQS